MQSASQVAVAHRSQAASRGISASATAQNVGDLLLRADRYRQRCEGSVEVAATPAAFVGLAVARL
jgi:hypothetical protein